MGGGTDGLDRRGEFTRRGHTIILADDGGKRLSLDAGSA
jgi:hypothetical protein